MNIILALLLIILFYLLVKKFYYDKFTNLNKCKFKLDCVLTACNNNKLYSGFIPMFIKSWNKLYPDVDIKIIFIDNDIPNELKKYRDSLILFKPLKNISTAFTSQYIRLLYPCILKQYKNGIMITDIDIIPMNNVYFTKNIEKYSNDKFIYFRNILLNNHQIAICYNIATSKVWSDIFNIKSINDINKRLSLVYSKIEYMDIHGKNGWSTDQLDLYKYELKWNKKNNNFISLDDNYTKFNRLNREIHIKNNKLSDEIKKNIKSGLYTDYHCIRPFEKYQEVNNEIISLLM